ncbi:MAG: hypothetical protein GY820_00770 [Gammaproteobacteria bacterium]|nr:hypothetical protein [Gammaproteobacteria bacterium]
MALNQGGQKPEDNRNRKCSGWGGPTIREEGGSDHGERKEEEVEHDAKQKVRD